MSQSSAAASIVMQEATLSIIEAAAIQPASDEHLLICHHMDFIDPLEDGKYSSEKFKRFLAILRARKAAAVAATQIPQANTNSFNYEEYARNPEEWICLHDGCDSVFIKKALDDFSILQHVHSNSDRPSPSTSNTPSQPDPTSEEQKHCLFINCQTTEIRCIDCSIEILDLAMYAPSKSEELCRRQWVSPRRIRDIFHQAQFDWDSNLLKSNLSNPKSHWRSSKGLCGLAKSSNSSCMSAIVQIIGNIPLLRQVFKKMHAVYGQFENVAPRSPVRRVSFYLTKLLNAMWTGANRVIDPEDFYRSIYAIDARLCGYQFQDAHEFFKRLVTVLQEDFKFIAKKSLDDTRKKQQQEDTRHTSIAPPPPDEWDVINNMKDYSEYSVISQTFKGKRCVRASCASCKFVYWFEEDFTTFSLDVPPNDWKPRKEDSSNTTQASSSHGNTDKQHPTKDSYSSQKSDSNNSSGGGSSGSGGGGLFSKIFAGRSGSRRNSFSKKEGGYSLIDVFTYNCEANTTSMQQKPFYCEECKNRVAVSRTTSLLNLPNILCLHISRFRVGPGRLVAKNPAAIDFPVDNLDLKQFVKHLDGYEQQNLTCYELVGVIEHTSQQGGDEYVSIVKNAKNGMFYRFADSSFRVYDFTKETVAAPYLLFYRLKAQQIANGSGGLLRNLTSHLQLVKEGELKIDEERSVYLPGFWYEKLKYLAKPGPLASHHLLCPHGKVKPDYFDCFPPRSTNHRPSASSMLMAEGSVIDVTMDGSNAGGVENNYHDSFDTNYALEFLKNQSIIVPREIAAFIVESQGMQASETLIDAKLQICNECIRSARNIKRRRKIERLLIAKFDKKFTEETYIIEEGWMNRWKEFLYSQKKLLKRNFIKGMPMPGPIDNKLLLGPANVLKPGMKRNIHFRIVNDYIWQILKQLYGGGPALVINDFNSRKRNYQKPSLPRSDAEQIQEMLLLTDKRKYNEVMKNILTEDLTRKQSSNVVNSMTSVQLQQQFAKMRSTSLSSGGGAASYASDRTTMTKTMMSEDKRSSSIDQIAKDRGFSFLPSRNPLTISSRQPTSTTTIANSTTYNNNSGNSSNEKTFKQRTIDLPLEKIKL